jgi:hypothetical protein
MAKPYSQDLRERMEHDQKKLFDFFDRGVVHHLSQ